MLSGGARYIRGFGLFARWINTTLLARVSVQPGGPSKTKQAWGSEERNPLSILPAQHTLPTSSPPRPLPFRRPLPGFISTLLFVLWQKIALSTMQPSSGIGTLKQRGEILSAVSDAPVW